MLRQKQKGVTLIELMIVVVIVAILAGVAWPGYTRHLQKSHRTEMQASLTSFAITMETWKSQNFSYRNATVAALDPTLAANKHYNVNLTLTNNDQAYNITVTPKTGQMSGTGALALDSQGRSCYNKSNDTACDLTDDALRWSRE
ncbi:MAG: type IV pilin protein [Alcanivoracaceae bacterium]|nr:type IV pilin protein [Alcanivoracaceae bacterium]